MENPEYQPEGGNLPFTNTPYASPFHQLGSTILLLTNPEDELRKLELTLRNAYEDDKGIVAFRHMKDKEGNLVPVPPLLNDEGVASIVGQVQAVVNRVTVMSNLSEEKIYNLEMYLCDTIVKDLIINRRRYGITNPSARDRIVHSALTTAWTCLHRSMEEGERRFLKGSTQEMTMRSEGGQQKPGILSKVLGWGNQK